MPAKGVRVVMSPHAAGRFSKRFPDRDVWAEFAASRATDEWELAGLGVNVVRTRPEVVGLLVNESCRAVFVLRRTGRRSVIVMTVLRYRPVRTPRKPGIERFCRLASRAATRRMLGLQPVEGGPCP